MKALFAEIFTLNCQNFVILSFFRAFKSLKINHFCCEKMDLSVKFKFLDVSTNDSYFRRQFDSKLVRRDWIVVSKEVPVDIPPVAGLITEQLQTPLCHIALLCSNRKTPNMGLVDAIKYVAKKLTDPHQI